MLISANVHMHDDENVRFRIIELSNHTLTLQLETTTYEHVCIFPTRQQLEQLHQTLSEYLYQQDYSVQTEPEKEVV